MRVSSLDWEGCGEEAVGFVPGLFLHVYYFIIRPISLETIRSSKISKKGYVAQMGVIWVFELVGSIAVGSCQLYASIDEMGY